MRLACSREVATLCPSHCNFVFDVVPAFLRFITGSLFIVPTMMCWQIKIRVALVTGLKTKREAVELGLKTLLMLKKQDEIKQFKGKLKWDDDLDRMRTD